MTLDTSANVATLRGLTAEFDHGVEMAEPFYPELCTIRPSSGADEQYGLLGSMPGVKEWLGERQYAKLLAAKWTIENKLWENSAELEKTHLEDDRIGIYNDLLAEMGLEAAHHPDELVAELIVNGESEVCFDGQFFYDTDHQWGDSGSQSNDLEYNAADPDVVTEAEFRAAYHQARAAMLAFKRDNGKPYIRPTLRPFRKLILQVPPQLEEVADQAINKTLVSGGETNRVLDKPMIVPTPYLTNGRKFYLHNVGSRLKPFVFQARRPLMRQMTGMNDSNLKYVRFNTDARYNAGFAAWFNSVVTLFT